MKLDKIEMYLGTIKPPLDETHKINLYTMFYNAYLEGIEEGSQQVKNKMIENLLLLMDTDK